MAETKTNIPIEIKMGNAGEGDANLPAFKEGSIIFTKDTKKLYVDAPGATERIQIGLSETDLSNKQDKFATATNYEYKKETYTTLTADSDYLTIEAPNKLFLGAADANISISPSYFGGEFFPTLSFGNGGITELAPMWETYFSYNYVQNLTFDDDNLQFVVTGTDYVEGNILGFQLVIGGPWTFDVQHFESDDGYILIETVKNKYKITKTNLSVEIPEGDAIKSVRIRTNKTTPYLCFNGTEITRKKRTNNEVVDKQSFDTLANIVMTDKQDKFADYSETTDGLIYKNLILGNDEALVIRGQDDNNAKIELEPSVININSQQININPTDRFTIGNILEMAASDEGDISVFSIGSSDVGQIHFKGSNLFTTSGITLQGDVENVATTGLNVNKNNIKLISWAYGNNTNNAPLLGVSDPVAEANTDKGIAADDIPYQAVNKQYVDTGLDKKLDETSSVLYTNKIALIPPGATSSDVITSIFLDMYGEPHIIFGADKDHPFISIPSGYSGSPLELYKDINIGSVPLKTSVDSNGVGTIHFGYLASPMKVKIYNIETDTTDDSSVVNYGQLKNSIATQISSVYKAKGSIADISALPTPDKDHEGFVYNIESGFTTTDLFVEGAGKTYPAGTNVVIVNTTGTEYKYDVLAGMVDLSNYATNDTLTTKLSGKLDKITTTASVPRAYTVLANGSQSILEVADTVRNNSIARRTSTGTLKAATPTANDDVATKKYVDDLIGNINSILATMFNDVSTQSDEEPTDEEVIA